MKMRNIQLLILISLVSCSLDNNLTIDKIPDRWSLLTNTDSGLVNVTHFDMGSTLLTIQDSKSVKLISDQSVLEFNIEKLDSTTSNSFLYSGVYTFDARLKGEKPQIGKLRFKWIDPENELSSWRIEFDGKIIIEEYFSSIRKVKKYPIVEIDCK